MGEPDLKQLIREGMLALATADGELVMSHSLPGLMALVSQFAAPDFVCVMAPIPPTPSREFAGVDGLEEAWADYGGAFENVRVELEEILESPRNLVILVNQFARTRQGVEVPQPSAMLFEIVDERITRIEFHLDQATALRAAGLDA